VDGRIDAGDPELFPHEMERLFADTYDTLVRVTEDADVARDLLTGVRDHLQSRIAESQNEVGKKLTVIASLVPRPLLRRRLLRPELPGRVRPRLLDGRLLHRRHRRLDAAPARDLPLAPLDIALRQIGVRRSAYSDRATP
jgi:hypothetical protein